MLLTCLDSALTEDKQAALPPSKTNQVTTSTSPSEFAVKNTEGITRVSNSSSSTYFYYFLTMQDTGDRIKRRRLEGLEHDDLQFAQERMLQATAGADGKVIVGLYHLLPIDD